MPSDTLNGPKFRLTPEHLRLARSLRFVWREGTLPAGAPAVCPKQPIANGDVELDIIRVLGWSRDAEPADILREKARTIYGDTLYVAQIVMQNAGMAVQCGAWQRDDDTHPKRWYFLGD